MKTLTKTISFDQVMKEFKKYVASSDMRPVLQYVYFDGSHFIATNSHVLLRVNKDYISDIPADIETGSLFDPKEMKLATDYQKTSYPETSRLISSYSNSTVLLNKENLKEFQQHVKEAKKAAKSHFSPIKFKFTQSYFGITSMCSLTKEIKERYGVSYTEEYKKLMEEDRKNGNNPPELSEYNAETNNIFVEGDEITFHVSPKYMNNAVITVKKLTKLNKDQLQLNMNGKMRPVQFNQGDVFDIIVMPIRMKY